ncbi:MAG TPA: hypothetical protein VH814_22830 [Steroidobacteraceae bacterium]
MIGNFTERLHMKNISQHLAMSLIASMLLVGCSKSEEKAAEGIAPQESAAPAAASDAADAAIDQRMGTDQAASGRDAADAGAAAADVARSAAGAAASTPYSMERPGDHAADDGEGPVDDEETAGTRRR